MYRLNSSFHASASAPYLGTDGRAERSHSHHIHLNPTSQDNISGEEGTPVTSEQEAN
jgi:hypothetical protein